MDDYRELYINGDIKVFLEDSLGIKKNDWKIYLEDLFTLKYLVIQYVGNLVHKARIYFVLKSHSTKDNEIHVANIVPDDVNALSIAEYNDILKKYYDDIIINMKNDAYTFEITDDKFNPNKYFSEESLKKLIKFSNNANKSTGSHHPCDEERWYDFIFQSVKDNAIVSPDTLVKFLTDEEFWSKQKFPMENSAWNIDKAEELANEYQLQTDILIAYIKQENQ